MSMDRCDGVPIMFEGQKWKPYKNVRVWVQECYLRGVRGPKGFDRDRS